MRVEKIIFTGQAIGNFFKRAIFHHSHRAKSLNSSEPQQADCCGEGVTKEKREKFQNLRDGEKLSMTSGSQGIHFAAQHFKLDMHPVSDLVVIGHSRAGLVESYDRLFCGQFVSLHQNTNLRKPNGERKRIK